MTTPIIDESTPVGKFETGDFYRLSIPVMQAVGRAAMTHAAIYRTSSKKTFMSNDKIAAAARIPGGTFDRHLAILIEHGFIENVRLKRTCEKRLTAKGRVKGEYLILPDCFVEALHTWAERAVSAAVVSHESWLKSVLEDTYGKADNYAFDDRSFLNVPKICNRTGLGRRTVQQTLCKLDGYCIHRTLNNIFLIGSELLHHDELFNAPS